MQGGVAVLRLDAFGVHLVELVKQIGWEFLNDWEVIWFHFQPRLCHIAAWTVVIETKGLSARYELPHTG